MATLYIDRTGSTLHADSGVLIVEHPGSDQRPTRAPMALVERVVLRADTTLTSGTLCALAEGGIALVAIGGRTGERVAQLVGPWHNNAEVRLKQTLTLADPGSATQLARQIVLAKIRRQRSAMHTLQEARPDLRKATFDALATLERILPRIGEAQGIDTIRGYEGAAAAAYFNAYFQMFPASLGATGRKRRPPPDPVNATLSLAYTLLYSIAVRACWMTGLDPALGALHGIAHKRAAMACDLMEPWRPMVDLWVWRQFRSGDLRAEHFGVDGARGCLLGKAGRAHFYRDWEACSRGIERGLRRHARLLANAMRIANADNLAHLEVGDDA